MAWGNYRGGLASTIRITSLPGLDSVEVPHEITADISPAWAGGKLYFLSARSGPISVFSFDAGDREQVAEVYRNTGADIRSLASDGQTLVFDRLGEIFTLTPGQAAEAGRASPRRATCRMCGRACWNVSDQVRAISVSPTGRADGGGGAWRDPDRRRSRRPDAQPHQHARRDGADAGVEPGWESVGVFFGRAGPTRSIAAADRRAR